MINPPTICRRCYERECLSLEQILGFSDIHRKEQQKENVGMDSQLILRSLLQVQFSLGACTSPSPFFHTRKTELSLLESAKTLVLLCVCVCVCVFTRGAHALKSCCNADVRAIWPSSLGKAWRSAVQFANRMARIPERLN